MNRAFVLCLLAGLAAGWLVSAGGQEPEAPVSISFTMPHDGYATLVIDDTEGNRVKNLFGALPFAEGPHTVKWSGLNDRDELMKPGRYHWRGLFRKPVHAIWRGAFYQPNTAQPWPNEAGTGGWGPDQGRILCVAAGDGRIYLAGNGVETGSGLFALDEDGRKLWSVQHAAADRLAWAGGRVYAYRGGRTLGWFKVATEGIMQFGSDDGRWIGIRKEDDKTLARCLALVEKHESVLGLVADEQGVYVAVWQGPAVRMLDRQTFKLKQSFNVPAVGELCALNDGRVLLLSREGIIELNTADGQTRTLLPGDFSGAKAAVAGGDGRVYVAFGQPDHVVRVYRRKDATLELVQTLGRQGGRGRTGPYDPSEGFVNPCSLAVDSRGRLWVVEDDDHPKRVSVWQDGKCVRDFLGSATRGGGGVISPAEPGSFFYDNMEFRLDLDTGVSRLVQVGIDLPANGADFGITRTADANYMVLYKDRPYLLSIHQLRQIARKKPDGRWGVCVHIDPIRVLAWIDRNDDWTVQEEEIVRGERKYAWGGTTYWGMYPSRSLDLFFARGGRKTGLRLALQGLSPGGTPLYDLSNIEEMTEEIGNGIGLQDGSYSSWHGGMDQSYFAEMRRIYPKDHTGAAVLWYSVKSFLGWGHQDAYPGTVLFPMQAHGTAPMPDGGGEVICWVGLFGQRYIFTDDMLFVAQLFQDERISTERWPDQPKPGFVADNMSPGRTAFNGNFARVGDGRYLLTAGITECSVFEVTGLESVQRIEGEVDLQEDDLAAARNIQQYLAEGQKKGELARIAKLNQAPPAIDGKLEDWPEGERLWISTPGRKRAEVRLAYNETYLFLGWTVPDDTPMRNGAERWQYAFNTGDAVEFMFRPPSDKVGFPGAQAGDLRLLVTRLQDKPTVVLYKPISATKQPFTFEMPDDAKTWASTTMDEVRLVDDVQAALVTEKGRYRVETAVPWTLLGGLPEPGKEGRIEFAVRFDGAKGLRTVARACWASGRPGIVGEGGITPELTPKGWGKVVLEK
ncbi:MAG: hypothetical protein JXR37_23885 [Kiritimatiellae bacterium]|nr:hypothetical protein [Kiritimatiellia bacterium]